MATIHRCVVIVASRLSDCYTFPSISLSFSLSHPSSVKVPPPHCFPTLSGSLIYLAGRWPAQLLASKRTLYTMSYISCIILPWFSCVVAEFFTASLSYEAGSRRCGHHDAADMLVARNITLEVDIIRRYRGLPMSPYMHQLKGSAPIINATMNIVTAADRGQSLVFSGSKIYGVSN